MKGRAGVRILAPAKVNLWLRVIRRRPDGFHEVDTLFQAVDLCDDVEVSCGPGAGVGLSVEGAELGPPRENLAYRAALAFLDAVGPGAGGARIQIRLRKRIPAGAGLGGGSSDAAAVLRCLSVLWGHPLSPPVLSEVGAALGSDVAFFLGSGPLTRGRGRGELLEPLPSLPQAHFVLVLPPVHVATGAAYGALARYRATHGDDARVTLAAGTDTWDELGGAAVNDFELVVPGAHPSISASLEALRRAGACPALLSGSGSACFGLFPGADRAREAADTLMAALGWPAVAVRTLDAFPTPRLLSGPECRSGGLGEVPREAGG